MCAVCNRNQGTPTNIAIQCIMYTDMPLCAMCVQLAVLAYRHPTLATQIHAKLQAVCSV